mmetsp:Transcript_41797/g.118319  ORF Transcript_41797/g.118319 Transcript_41797/m.118319 type:complete len:257 (-) Transcript_41797:6-776(-)
MALIRSVAPSQSGLLQSIFAPSFRALLICTHVCDLPKLLTKSLLPNAGSSRMCANSVARKYLFPSAATHKRLEATSACRSFSTAFGSSDGTTVSACVLWSKFAAEFERESARPVLSSGAVCETPGGNGCREAGARHARRVPSPGTDEERLTLRMLQGTSCIELNDTVELCNDENGPLAVDRCPHAGLCNVAPPAESKVAAEWEAPKPSCVDDNVARDLLFTTGWPKSGRYVSWYSGSTSGCKRYLLANFARKRGNV